MPLLMFYIKYLDMGYVEHIQSYGQNMNKNAPITY